MFRLSKISSRIRISIFALLIISTLVAVGGFVAKEIVKKTNAASSATVTYSENVRYGGDNNSASYTPIFTITTGGESYVGYCLQPHWLPAASGSSATVNSNFSQRFYSRLSYDYSDEILLMMYIYESDSTEAVAARNILFNNSRTPDRKKQYAWTHAIISAMVPLTGDSESGYYGGSYWLLNSADHTFVDGVISTLIGYVNNNAAVWQKAKKGTLYYMNGYEMNEGQDFGWASFPPDTVYGNIKVKKCDAETQACSPQGNASLQGIKFEVYNGSTKVTESTTNANGEVTFSNLPNATYTVKETSTNTSYNLDTSSGSGQTVTISTDGETKTLTFYDTVKRGDVKFYKKDEDNNTAMANVPFRITSTTTNESHIVVTNSDGVVDTSAIRHSLNTNKYDGLSDSQLYNVTYQGYGTWFGIGTTANDSLGALPYDTYVVVELNCDNNKFCYEIATEKQTFTISSNGTTVDLGTWENHCATFSLGTTATDNADGDKFVESASNATIKDTIEYCARENLTYKIVGTLMDKNTNQAIKTVTIDNFTPTTACGTTEMYFSFDASDIAGHDLVVFEKLYYGDELVASHEDINDTAQTIYVISLGTTATDTHDADHIIDADIEYSNIKDTIKYCLKKGETYKIKGILMNKNTRESLKVNGQEITQTIEITPTSACGQTSMIFDLDVSRLGGTEIVVFESVEYQNRDIITHADWDDEDQTINVFWMATLATDDSDGDQIIINEKETRIRDVIDYCLKAGEIYTIKSIMMNTKNGLPLEINGEKVEASIELTPTTNCGYAEVYFDIDPAEIAGINIVMFEELFYQGELVLEHNALYDNRETISVLSLTTMATDVSDGDKYLEANSKVTIKDEVNYCLIEDKTFTVEGVLMNKTTKEILLINGAPIKQTITITPETACGTTEMYYDVDTTGLGGAELVIFESLYYDGDRILTHQDFENTAETVSVLIPAPDTGLITRADWETQEDSPAPAILAGTLITVPIVCLGCMVISKKKIFNHHHTDF